MIHREVLVSKSLPSVLQDTMNEAVKVVNFIKSNALNTRIFSKLCEAMHSDHKCLLCHTEVCWLSKGKVLERIVLLKVEIVSFFDIQDHSFDFLHDENRWLRVILLSDIFEKLNTFNVNLQSDKENFITISGKLEAFHEKLKMWVESAANYDIQFFRGVNESQNKSYVITLIQEFLGNLLESFSKYFPSLDTSQIEWIINPFLLNSEAPNLPLAEKESLIDLKTDLVSKAAFNEKEVSEFWIFFINQYPELSKIAIKALLPFGSSYLCEFGFSALTAIKSKKTRTIDNDRRRNESLPIKN